MSFPCYESYKDSGVEWLGEVPAYWDIVRLKNVLQRRITDGPHSTPVFENDGVPFLSVDGIQDGELQFNGCRLISEDNHAEYRKKASPQRDDLLMGKAASTGKIARVKVDFEFSIWSPLALIRLDCAKSKPAFFEYSLKSPIVQAQIENFCTANTQKNISMDDIPKLVLTRPPLVEQISIANFLDRETAKIDSLIVEQQRLIELLKEKRQAVISHAVTKGLNPDALMKDTGIAWLGEVPKHWEVKRLGILSALIQTGPFGSQLHSGDYVADETPVINPSNIQDGQIVPDWSNTVGWGIVERLIQHKLLLGDIIFGRRGEMGRCAKVSDIEAGWLCGTGCLNVRLNDSAVSEFVSIYLRTEYVRELLKLESVGSTMDNLNTEILSRIHVPVPPLKEQLAIVAFLDCETTKLDTLTTEAQRAIELLKERRSALISAAVTGKIDVRTFTLSSS